MIGTERAMSKTLLIFLVAVVAAGVLVSPPAPVLCGSANDPTAVRAPAVAGQFYPSDREKLAGAVDGFLADALPPADERPIALVCPHAGYIFSGQIAADAYKQAAKHSYDLVVVMGVNHTTAGFQGVALSPASGFETPLGIASVDDALARTLAASDESFTFDESVHAREHSIEVQIPFIQRIFPGAKILPAIVASSDPALCAKFGEAVAQAVAGRKALIVASSDLSHYPDYDDAARVDRRTLEAISSLDPEAFRSAASRQMNDGVEELATCACGEASIVAAMAAARKLGATGARIISYANSGDTSVGDRTRVVGYGAVAFIAGKTTNNLPPLEKTEGGKSGSPAARDLTKEEKAALLSFARKFRSGA
ncbi:MAG: hypothetical protein H6Q78_1801 [Candidatus Krumholzibacteriota bacterium]|nr:hypothetical protein [Candidatus Krumholzibacteriota bacterium]